MAKRLANRVLLIGWDGADWQHIRPLLDKGWMPTLRSLMERGVWGNITTLQPVLSPMLWTSIATGKRPWKHGIHGFIEPDPDGNGVRPVSGTSRKCKALWNIAHQAELTSNVVSWWPSHPAEPIRGVCVSNFYQKVDMGPPRPWPIQPGTVSPERLTETLALLRVHPSELDGEALLPFVPKAAEIDQERDRRLGVLAKLIAECASVHAAATWLMEHEPWDLTAVYYDSVDHFCHAFMQYHPPRMPNTPERDFELYKDTIVGCYRLHDMMLARLLQLAGDDTTVILCSDHGFLSDHLRPLATPRYPAGPAAWHRQHGIFVMAGPGVRRGERIEAASVLDICPTVLHLFGLPVGEDMDGKVLVQAFETPQRIERIPSWEEVEGECGMHPPDRREDPLEAQQALQQLVDLGYVEPPPKDKRKAIDQAVQEARYNLACAEYDAGRLVEATELFEWLHEQKPEDARFAMGLAQCRLAAGRVAESERLVEQVLERRERQAHEAIKRRNRRREALRQARGEPPEGTDGAQAHEGGEPPAEPPAGPSPSVQLMRAHMALAAGRAERALAMLDELRRAAPRLRGLHLALGRAHLALGEHAAAEQALRTGLEIEPESPEIHEALVSALLAQGKHEQAVACGLDAAGLDPNNAATHLQLGRALLAFGHPAEARAAFEAAARLRPGLLEARRELVALLEGPLADAEAAAEHRRVLEELEQQLGAEQRRGAART